jgi:16S rRNA (cytosine967-C5)-methyltransferase
MDDPAEQGLYAELCYGTLRQFPRLNLILGILLKNHLKPQDADVRALLLIGLYQLAFMRIPDHAVLDQTVEAVSGLGKKWARGLTNAILRNYLREKDQIDKTLEGEMAYKTSLPEWLIHEWQTAWPEKFDQIAETANQYPPMSLRVNCQKHTRDDYIGLLAESGIEAHAGSLGDASITLAQPVAVSLLPGFFEGSCSVQDEAAQLCAPLLQLEPGMHVLDACSAPGGKAGHLLETCPDIELLALDNSSRRLKDVQSNLDRLGLQSKLQAEDAAAINKWWDKRPFDRILLDAPCSGTGVIRRHPDIKVLRRPTDIDGFRQQQLRLLEGLWPTLAENGLLLYVTCSIMPAENELQIEQFSARNPEAEVLPVSVNWGTSLSLGRQLLPGDQRADGFYFALLKKRREN